MTRSESFGLDHFGLDRFGHDHTSTMSGMSTLQLSRHWSTTTQKGHSTCADLEQRSRHQQGTLGLLHRCFQSLAPAGRCGRRRYSAHSCKYYTFIRDDSLIGDSQYRVAALKVTASKRCDKADMPRCKLPPKRQEKTERIWPWHACFTVSLYGAVQVIPGISPPASVEPSCCLSSPLGASFLWRRRRALHTGRWRCQSASAQEALQGQQAGGQCKLGDVQSAMLSCHCCHALSCPCAGMHYALFPPHNFSPATPSPPHLQ